MTRRMLLAGLVGLLVLVVAPAAWAKCNPDADREHGGCVEVTSASASISGPGLGVPLTISGPPVFDIARQAGINGYRPYHYDGQAFFPGIEGLGPKYVIDFVIRTETGKAWRVTADLYPYAQNLAVPGAPSAWVLLPEGALLPTTESFGDGRLFVFGRAEGEPGWWKSGALYYTLVQEGLPSDSPVSLTASGAGAAEAPAQDAVTSRSDGVPAGLRAGLMLAALAVMLVAAAFAGRRRHGAIA